MAEILVYIKPYIQIESSPDEIAWVYKENDVYYVTLSRAYDNQEDFDNNKNNGFRENIPHTLIESELISFIETAAIISPEIEAQQVINKAQQKVIDRLAETMDKLLGYIASANPLTAPQQLFVNDFRNDYADYITKRDAQINEY